MLKGFHYTAFALLLIVCLIGCTSNSNNPTQSQIETSAIEYNLSDNNPAFQDYIENIGNTLAVYECYIDPAAGTFANEPVSRSGEYHFPLTQLYPNVLQITGYGFTPNFWADIRLVHPFPGSGIDAFDPRVIAIFPANPGVSFNYPILNVQANNSVLHECDGYTRLHDNLGGSIPGNTNPVKAYFKDQPNRVWSSTVETEETQRWDMDLSGFGGPLSFVLVVDVSTNYPNPPQPIIDNAKEPVEIQLSVRPNLDPDGGSSEAKVTLHDWQGSSEIAGIKIEAPDVFDGLVSLVYIEPGPNSDEYVYQGTISNEKLVPEGEYRCLVSALDLVTGVYIYQEFPLVVSDISFNLTNVTPSWLNMSFSDVCISGNYAYVSAYSDGLYVYDITDLMNPQRLCIMDTPSSAYSLTLSGNYLYITDFYNGLHIVNISSPQNPFIEKSIDTPTRARYVDLYDGYAYVTDDDSLQIIDVDPVETAHIVNTIPTDSNINSIGLKYPYAFAASGTEGLYLIDISNPESAMVVDTFEILWGARNIKIDGNYAYITSHLRFFIVDISDPMNCEITGEYTQLYSGGYIEVADGLAYVCTENSWRGLNFLVIDVSTPETPELISSKFFTGKPSHMELVGDKVFLACKNGGLKIVDVSLPESVTMINSIEGLGDSWEICLHDDLAYVSDGDLGLKILDIHNPEYTQVIKVADTHTSLPLAMSERYLYTTESIMFRAYDIIDPMSPQFVADIELMHDTWDIELFGSFAFLTGYYEGFKSLRVSPPSLMEVLNTNNYYPFPTDAAVSYRNYAYACTPYGLNVINLTSPGWINIVDTILESESVQGVTTQDDYAYVSGHNDFLILDISFPAIPEVINSINSDHLNTARLVVENGYAYAVGPNGLAVIAVDPPETMYVVDTIELSDKSWSIAVQDGYAYVTCKSGGLQIIRLW